MAGRAGLAKVDVGPAAVSSAPNLAEARSPNGGGLGCASWDDARGNSISPEPKRTVTAITNLSRLCMFRPPVEEIGTRFERLNTASSLLPMTRVRKNRGVSASLPVLTLKSSKRIEASETDRRPIPNVKSEGGS
jgi:hypothetical protein